MSPNRRSAERIDRAGICRAYGERPATVDSWVKLLNFPGPLDPEEWDAQQVDQWVKGNRPQSWPARAAQPDAVAVEPSASRSELEDSAVQDGESVGSGELLGKSGLAQRYRVADSTVDTWTRSAGTNPFPAAPEPGRWRVGDVDTWVRNNRVHVWAEINGEGPTVVIAPPDGDPKDLYDIGGYGTILGNATRGEPLPRSTAQSYKNHGHLEPPDRKPGDRKRPEVFEEMWFLETITKHVYSRRGQGRVRAGRTRGAGKQR